MCEAAQDSLRNGSKLEAPEDVPKIKKRVSYTSKGGGSLREGETNDIASSPPRAHRAPTEEKNTDLKTVTAGIDKEGTETSN